MHVCRSNLPITAHHTGRVQEHMKAECKNTQGRVQEHTKAECKNTWRQSARTHGGRVQKHTKETKKTAQESEGWSSLPAQS